jgi:transposase-like protein
MRPDFFECFRDEASAYRFVEQCIWSKGPTCPHCGGWQRVGKLQGQSTQIGTYKCYHCRKLFTVKTGTIFASSHIPLHKWLQGIYLCGCGTAPLKPQELSRILNVTFKTSALMISRMRSAALQGGLAESAAFCPSVLDQSHPLAGSLASDVPTAPSRIHSLTVQAD